MGRTEKPDPPIGEAFQRFSFSPTIDGESFRGAFPSHKKKSVSHEGKKFLNEEVCVVRPQEPQRTVIRSKKIVILNLFQDLLEGRE